VEMRPGPPVHDGHCFRSEGSAALVADLYSTIMP
jgi:hypothetical protein